MPPKQQFRNPASFLLEQVTSMCVYVKPAERERAGSLGWARLLFHPLKLSHVTTPNKADWEMKSSCVIRREGKRFSWSAVRPRTSHFMWPAGKHIVWRELFSILSEHPGQTHTPAIKLMENTLSQKNSQPYLRFYGSPHLWTLLNLRNRKIWLIMPSSMI